VAKLLGIDVGTSGCKLMLVDENGLVLKQASAEYPLSVPRPMWSEQNPEDWWKGVSKCLSEIDEPAIDAIGVTGQMHGAVFLDSNEMVVRPAILWNDQRTTAECRQIDDTVGPDRVKQLTCNPPLTGFQVPKVLWLRNNEPDEFRRVRTVLLPKDYIRFKLSGVMATDVSDASGTGVFDVANRKWSSEMLAALNLSQDLFPPCLESFQVSARTPEGVPVVAGGGDQAAAAVGTGAVEPGVLSVSLGTSGVVFTAIEAPEYDLSGSAHTFCHANGKWHAMGVMLSCGGSLRWFRDSVFRAGGYDEIASIAARSDPGCDGLTFLPYLTGERCPHNDPYARASFAGISLAHGIEHLSRSVFEGVSFGLLGCLRLLKNLGAEANELRVTSGGAKSRFWVQMLADIFQKPCVTLEADEGPAFGAALLAGVGIGIWPDTVNACKAVVRIAERFEPHAVDYSAAYSRFTALYPRMQGWG